MSSGVPFTINHANIDSKDNGGRREYYTKKESKDRDFAVFKMQVLHAFVPDV